MFPPVMTTVVIAIIYDVAGIVLYLVPLVYMWNLISSQCGGANFRFDELNQDDGILHFVTGTYGIQNLLLVKSGNSGFLIFSKNWKMGYQFRHVLIVPEAQAWELKPHLWNNEDLWKKLGSLSIGIPSTENSFFCPKLEQCGCCREDSST